MAKPILKWAGGKSQILHEILPRLPSDFKSYHEPFFGGGAVFFELQPPNGTINDVNDRLMNFYRQVRDNPTNLIEENRGLQKQLDPIDNEDDFKDFYYDRRDEFNSLRQHGLCENEIREASLLMFINLTCFNGLYRENNSGEFNTPAGDNWDADVARADRIRAASKALNDTDIRNQDFSYVEYAAREGDAVYFDPPYKSAPEEANFRDYTAGGFDEEKQRELRDLAVDLHQQGVYVTISNSLAARSLYEDSDAVPDGIFDIDQVAANRVINSKGDERTGAQEIVITNVPMDKRHGTLSSFAQKTQSE